MKMFFVNDSFMVDLERVMAVNVNHDKLEFTFILEGGVELKVDFHDTGLFNAVHESLIHNLESLNDQSDWEMDTTLN